MIWVVETKVDGKWEPTPAAWLTRKAAREDLRWWKHANANDKFRVSKYVRGMEWFA